MTSKPEAIWNRIERNLWHLERAEAGKRCVLCNHLRHNKLSYCQTSQCPCSNGTSVSATAMVIRRDLGEYFDALDGDAGEKR